jgi:hypothetical protein
MTTEAIARENRLDILIEINLSRALCPAPAFLSAATAGYKECSRKAQRDC